VSCFIPLFNIDRLHFEHQNTNYLIWLKSYLVSFIDTITLYVERQNRSLFIWYKSYFKTNFSTDRPRANARISSLCARHGCDPYLLQKFCMSWTSTLTSSLCTSIFSTDRLLVERRYTYSLICSKSYLEQMFSTYKLHVELQYILSTDTLHVDNQKSYFITFI